MTPTTRPRKNPGKEARNGANEKKGKGWTEDSVPPAGAKVLVQRPGGIAYIPGNHERSRSEGQPEPGADRFPPASPSRRPDEPDETYDLVGC
ncbi:MAG: hypothetical protein JWR80_6365 [Bradyrhizobium sp.]|nr:hypothetical protein [Bradyrhizobium sp.]